MDAEAAVERLLCGGGYPDVYDTEDYDVLTDTGYAIEDRGAPQGLLRPPSRERLDDFPHGTLCLQSVRRLAGSRKRGDFLKWCTDSATFAEALTSRVPLPGPRSDVKPSFVAKCCAAGVMTPVRECDRKRGVVAIFDVPKADPLVRRLVVDGRPVNTRLPKPPKLSLPSPFSLARSMDSHKAGWATVIDLRGYFHQFPLSPDVAAFFCVRVGHTWYRWCRLPMGFSYAPWIAQNTSEVFLGELLASGSAVYLDDMIVIGASEIEVRARAAYVRDRIAYCKGEINEAKSMQAPAQRVSYIGLEWDVPCAAFRFPEAWKQKALSSLTASCDREEATLLAWWAMFGVLFRVTYVAQLKLCHFCDSIQFIRRWAKRIADHVCGWNAVVRLPEGVRRDVRGLVQAHLAPNRWLHAPPLPLSVFAGTVWSDASTTGWGFVSSTVGDPLSQAEWGTWEREYLSGDMFHLELWAAEKALRYAGRSGWPSVLLWVDNDAVRLVLQKGHTKTRLGNDILRRIFSGLQAAKMTLHVEWISTEVMPADSWSRKRSSGSARIPRCAENVTFCVGGVRSADAKGL